MIHIVFGSSAAGTLRQVLHTRGLRQRVVDLQDHLHWGPISSGNFKNRGAWLDQHSPHELGSHGWLDEATAKFCQRVEADDDRLIWVAPHCAAELSGLYWFLGQFGGAGARMVIADYHVRGWNGPPPTLGMLDEKAMGELFDGTPSAWDEQRFPEDRWFGLMAEDALLRIVDAGKLRSAPENFFDDFIWQRVPDRPTKLLRAVGNIMAASFDLENSLHDDFIIWRLRELFKQGKIRSEGGPPRHVLDAKSAPMIQRIG